MFTDRIAFSHWNENDTNLAVALWGDNAVTRYISASGRFTSKEIENRLRLEMDNKNHYGIQYWPIFEREADTFIGCCGLRPYQVEKRVYELGVHLRKNFWGKGFASEAVRAAIKYAFETLNADKLFAGHNPNNMRSKNLLERLGFIYVRDEYYEPTGLYHPSYILTGNVKRDI